MDNTGKIPPEVSSKLRTLAHDLSNSLETILQASYLLTQMQMEEKARTWIGMIDQAGRDAAKINLEIRDVLRSAM